MPNFAMEDEFDLMKETAFLINTARGAIVDEPALIRALEAKKIAGAGLDTVEQEPFEGLARAVDQIYSIVCIKHMKTEKISDKFL